MTLSARWPNHKLFKVLQRSRETLNAYVKGLLQIDWFAEVKITTLTGVEGRWAKHTAKITGQANLDVQTAYAQLLARIQALAALYKGLRQWNQSPQMYTLKNTLPQRDILDRYFCAIGTAVAPDMQIVKSYARFFGAFFSNESSIAAAFETLNPEDLTSHASNFVQARAKKPPPPLPDDAESPCRCPSNGWR